MNTAEVLEQPCRSIRVLLVDDDEDFRSGLAAILRDDGHDVRECANAAEVPDADDLDDIEVLITDYEMPGQDGCALADRFHEAHPHAPVVMVTGHRHCAAGPGAREFLRRLPKPLDYEELHALIHALVQSFASPPAADSNGDGL